MANTRITQGMINTQLLRNLRGNLNRMDNYQNQLSTGRRINKPSDDPIGLSFALRYRSDLGQNDQFQSNVDSATSWLDNTDSTLNNANSVLQRVRELAVKGANGTNSQESLNAIKSEVDQLYAELAKIGNTSFNGKYIFNGQKTDVPPYNAASAEMSTTDTGTVQLEIGVGVKLPVNVSGNKAFGGPTGTGDNMFQIIKDLSTSLGSGDTAGASDILGRFDKQMDSFLGVRAEVGAATNRVSLADQRLKDISANLQSLQSKVEDADIAGTITNLKTAENVYQSSLSVGSKLISPSLVDFLH